MSRQTWVLGPLGRRVLAAFAAVSLSAVGLVAVMAMRVVQTQTVGLAAGQRAHAEQTIVAALAHAFRTAGSWERADLTAARASAQAAGLQVVVLNAAGGPVARLEPTPEPPPRRPAPTRRPESGTGPQGTGTASTTPTTRPAPAPSGSVTAPTPNGPGHGRGSPGSGQTGQPGPGNGRGWQTGALPTTGPAAAPVVALVAVRAAPGSAPGSVAVRAVRAVPGSATTADAAGTSAPTNPAGATAQGLPVVVDGVTVGRALIEPAPQVVVPAEAARAAILRTVGWAALAAGVLAVLVSFLATRRITRPLVALAHAAQAVERADPEATRLLRPGPGELGTVAAAFAQMATSVRRTDELRRAMAADVAHELRTPVTILRGGTEQMLDGLAPVSLEAVASLHEEVLRLERLVDDLAALSAAAAAGLSLRVAPVDLGDLVHRTIAQLRPQVTEAGQRITVTTDGGGSGLVVDGDADRLTQVVTNLLVNAIAYTPSGGGIGVDLRRQGDRIALTVADTGPGIAPDVLPHVFERFFRGASSAGPQGTGPQGTGPQGGGRQGTGRQGTGIGLAVVAELVRAHAGTVTAASPPGRGAVFTVLLPARSARSARSAPSERPEVRVPPAG